MSVVIPETDQALYRALAEELRDQIDTGALAPGEKLPSLRRMAQLRKVSVTTVLEAYGRLQDWGVVEARPQSGYYVLAGYESPCERPAPVAIPEPYEVRHTGQISAMLAEAVSGGGMPFGAAIVSTELLPYQQLARKLGDVCRRKAAAMQRYEFSPGYAPLRRHIARRYAATGVACNADDIVITSGCTEAGQLSLRAVTRPGDTVAIASPTYYGFLEWLESLGLRALEIPADADTGMDMDALASVMRAGRAQAVLTTPTYGNPLGSLMPEDSKRQLAALAAEHAVPIIEDDIYGELPFSGERTPPIKAFDRDERVLLCTSFSKSLVAGFRVGAVVNRRYCEGLAQLKRCASLANSTPEQIAIADYLESGGYDRHLRRLRHVLGDSMHRFSRCVAESFPEGTRLSRPQGGFVLWVELPAGSDGFKLKTAAQRAGIQIVSGHIFAPDDRYAHCIRLNTGIRWTPEVEHALRTLGRLAKELV
ncbi:MAG: aminotransferase class I/II-fold pyridoxal phosphate-dependent enzyme [Candidatus Hydrogenedens sp.]|nr:aminotransferase class I/II-fold pyridoxal phosphate-dependent enzyme [Candidatus Hydrogenedens sp.]